MTNKFISKLRRLTVLLKEMGMTSIAIHTNYSPDADIKGTYNDARDHLNKQKGNTGGFYHFDIAYNIGELHLEYLAFTPKTWANSGNIRPEIVCDISENKWEVVRGGEKMEKHGLTVIGGGKIEITEEFVAKCTELLEKTYIVKKREEIVNKMAQTELDKVYAASMA